MGNTLCYDTESQEVQYLIKADPILASLIIKINKREVVLSNDYFIALLNSIIGQQLSNRVADILSERFWRLFDSSPTPKDIVNFDARKIRACGIAEFKIAYMKNLAVAIDSGVVNFELFEKYSDNEIITILTNIKGIGPWTVEMFLLFNMGRRNIFSRSDAGLKRAICLLYQINKDEYLGIIDSITSKWYPFQSVACLFLWAGLDMNFIK